MSLVRDKNSIVRIIIISIQIANRGKVAAVTSKRSEELVYSVTRSVYLHELIILVINWCFIFHTGAPNSPWSISKNTECTKVLASNTFKHQTTFNCFMPPFIPHKSFIAARMFVYINSRTNTLISFRTKEQIANHLSRRCRECLVKDLETKCASQ